MKHLRNLLGLALLGLVLVLVGCGSTVQSGTTVTAQPAQPQPTATKAVAIPVVGKSYVVNSTWTVTVNGAKTSQGSDYVTPKSGNVFLIVDVTLKNTSTQVQHASGFVQWSIKDSTGQKYDGTFLPGTTDPGGALAPGSIIRGQLAYEVPKSIHTYILQFNDFGSSDIAEWEIKI
jgi:hypothetical protein